MTAQDQDDLTTRYGRPSPWRRRLTWLLALVVVAVSGTWVVWALTGQSNPSAKSTLVSFDVVDEHTVNARVQLRIDSEAEDVSCVLRAFAEDHVTVGEHVFTPDADDTTRLEQVRTERRATSIELLGCTAEGQPQYR